MLLVVPKKSATALFACLALAACGEPMSLPPDAPEPQTEPRSDTPKPLEPAEAVWVSSAAPEGEVVELCAEGSGPTIPVLLVDFWLTDQPDRRRALAERLETDFASATDCKVTIEILGTEALPAPTHDTTEIRARYPDVSEMDAQRLWYYESNNVKQILVDLARALEDADAMPVPNTLIIALSEPQFEASAYYIPKDAEGLEPLIIVESHSLGGWTLGPDYTSDSHSAPYLSDEIIHELGHFMGLRHACSSCFELGDYYAMLACCDACPHADDVMSYCRERLSPEHTETHEFGTCTMDWIESSFVPAYDAGGDAPVQPEACEK